MTKEPNHIDSVISALGDHFVGTLSLENQDILVVFVGKHATIEFYESLHEAFRKIGISNQWLILPDNVKMGTIKLPNPEEELRKLIVKHPNLDIPG